MKHIILILFIAISVGWGKAITLRNLLVTATQNNQKIKFQQEKIVESKSKVSIDSALPDPQLTGGYFLSPIETKTGPQEWKIGISQKIPLGGKLSVQENLALIDIDIAQVKLLQTKLSIQTQLINYFEEARAIKSELKIINEYISIIQNTEIIIKSKFKMNMAKQNDVSILKIERLQLKDSQTILQNKIIIIYNNIESLLGKPFEDELEFSEIQLDISKYNNYLNNTHYKIAQLEVTKSELNIKLSKLSYIPDLIAGLDYIHIDSNVGEDPFMVKFGVNLPIWFGKNNAKVKSSKANNRATNYQFTDIDNHNLAQYSMLNFDLKNSHRTAKLYRDKLIPTAQITMNSLQLSYISGNTSFVDYMGAFKLVLKLQKTQIINIKNYQLANARLLEFTGQLLETE